MKARLKLKQNELVFLAKLQCRLQFDTFSPPGTFCDRLAIGSPNMKALTAMSASGSRLERLQSQIRRVDT